MGSTNVIKATKAAIKECPREIFNFYLLACACIWSFSGVAKGFDEGNIASVVVLPVFKKRFNLQSLNEKDYADTKGWIVAIATAGAVFGCLACVYLTQRLGRRLTFQMLTLIYIAGVLGQTFSNGCTKSFADTEKQWMLPTALQLVPAVIWLVGCSFTPETPRFLLSQNKRTEALATLVRFRNLPEDHPYVRNEFARIEDQLNLELELAAGSTFLDLVRETFATVENRRRFFLMFFCHVFGQWSGANGITQYSPTVLGYLGITGTEASFLATGVYAIVKFASVLVFSLFMIDFIGRRRSLISGITLQILTLGYIGAYLGVTTGWSAERIESTPAALGASRMAIVAIYFHAVAWSIGWFSIPYLVSAEIFPLRIRSLNVSVGMAVHWANYFGCSRAMPSLLVGTNRYGAFVFFCCICIVSLCYVYFAMPETAGRSLESMDKLFDHPWYEVHKYAYPRPEDLKQEMRTDKELRLDEEKADEAAAGKTKHTE
ncbi:hypothetical protein MCOR27_006130 [Pyricularia oryzae]|nr:hypothetical protein MCOR02_003397 [Pyricularia oryzae]KAI6254642.1 hypothetical protein MCOR19_008863 [Pyricularia oryzae]KAI6277134.1 hypothetical protein MCOR27_006130 [Pyricularia oryzae]KAI6310788.1 hypothetical protein MCOR29_008486 [Pyricularia oryzae]KAI6320158.1 hypothetical protein MCOR34_003074 [Pyricularia oryzae]